MREKDRIIYALYKKLDSANDDERERIFLELKETLPDQYESIKKAWGKVESFDKGEMTEAELDALRESHVAHIMSRIRAAMILVGVALLLVAFIIHY